MAADRPISHRYEHLDGLRGLAALNVVVGHIVVASDFALYTGLAADSRSQWDVALSAWPLLLPVAGANFSVCVFLVLSGFVLAHAFHFGRLGALALAVKRALRLGVPILFATLFSWALLAAGLTYNRPVIALWRSHWLDEQLAHGAHLADALREGTYGSLIGPWSFTTSYDSALWTMPIEFTGSLLLIGLARVGWRRWKLRESRTLAGIVALIAGVMAYPVYLSLMLFGAAIYLLDPRRLEPRLTRTWLTGAMLAMAVLLGTAPFSAARGWGWDKMVAAAPAGILPSRCFALCQGFVVMEKTARWHAAGAILLLMAVETSPTVRRMLATKMPLFLGRISFPLYLLHVPLLMSVGCGTFLLLHAVGLGPRSGLVLAAAVFLGAAIGAATAATKVVERPSIRIAAWGGAWVQARIGRLLRVVNHARDES